MTLVNLYIFYIGFSAWSITQSVNDFATMIIAIIALAITAITQFSALIDHVRKLALKFNTKKVKSVISDMLADGKITRTELVELIRTILAEPDTSNDVGEKEK
jgi:uncharacterized membrane protein YbjE (DUF340 family)